MAVVFSIYIMCLISYSYIIIYIKWGNATFTGLTVKTKGCREQELSLFRTALQQNLIGNQKKGSLCKVPFTKIFPIMFLHIPALHALRWCTGYGCSLETT